MNDLPSIPGQHAATLAPVTLLAHQLATGDHLLRLGGVGFAQLRDVDAPPVIVADVRPPLETDAADNEGDLIVEIVTSAGVLYARHNAPSLALRNNVVSPHTVLLISRRAGLHARLVEFGVPVIRRTPTEQGKTAALVTAQEWETAPLIVIDGYLSRTTVQRMWARGDLIDRDPIIMIGTDPDDVRVYPRKAAARARYLGILPYDKTTIATMFHAAVATDSDTDHDPFLGILTPRRT